MPEGASFPRHCLFLRSDALQAAVRDHVCTFFLERNKCDRIQQPSLCMLHAPHRAHVRCGSRSAATVTIRDGVLHVTISAERVELRNYWCAMGWAFAARARVHTP